MNSFQTWFDTTRFAGAFYAAKFQFESNGKVRVSFDGERFTVMDPTTGSKIVVGRRKRLRYYVGGIQQRLDRLASEYMLERIVFRDNDVVIDCGANIGEIGMWLSAQRRALSYIPIEPSAVEADCCAKNNAGFALDVIRNPLWSSEVEMSFYDANDTGDSSLFHPASNHRQATKVRTTTLRDVMARLGISKIRLLKLEAEGAEPEILDGSGEMLRQIDFISADCGPERGVQNEPTFEQVSERLTAAGFELMAAHEKRATFLFRNRDAA